MAKYRMPVICAYCKKLMRMTTSNEPGRESHGICPQCRKKVESEDADLRKRQAKDPTKWN